MARTTYVQHAKARYGVAPVIDPTLGRQRVIPVLRKDGTPKTTADGFAVTMRVTRTDKSKPLPNRTCDECHTEIAVGDPYKHITPRYGPYGRTMVRCGTCPNWEGLDSQSRLDAQLARISRDAWDAFNSYTLECIADVLVILTEAAEKIREIADRKTKGSERIWDLLGMAPARARSWMTSPSNSATGQTTSSRPICLISPTLISSAKNAAGSVWSTTPSTTGVRLSVMTIPRRSSALVARATDWPFLRRTNLRRPRWTTGGRRSRGSWPSWTSPRS